MPFNIPKFKKLTVTDMAKYYYNNELGKRIYIKDIDFAEEKLTFTENELEAYCGRDGYYANATKDFIQTNFGKLYPELANVQCSAPYY